MLSQLLRGQVKVTVARRDPRILMRSCIPASLPAGGTTTAPRRPLSAQGAQEHLDGSGRGLRPGRLMKRPCGATDQNYGLVQDREID